MSPLSPLYPFPLTRCYPLSFDWDRKGNTTDSLQPNFFESFFIISFTFFFTLTQNPIFQYLKLLKNFILNQIHSRYHHHILFSMARLRLVGSLLRRLLGRLRLVGAPAACWGACGLLGRSFVACWGACGFLGRLRLVGLLQINLYLRL